MNGRRRRGTALARERNELEKRRKGKELYPSFPFQSPSNKWSVREVPSPPRRARIRRVLSVTRKKNVRALWIICKLNLSAAIG